MGLGVGVRVRVRGKGRPLLALERGGKARVQGTGGARRLQRDGGEI